MPQKSDKVKPKGVSVVEEDFVDFDEEFSRGGKETPEGFEKLPKRPRDKTFGCPDWIEDVVIPLGERGALLWRQLSTTWVGPENESQLRKEWEKFSPHVKDWG